jgi:2-dehydro-3-deoxygluconokinase
VSVDIVAPEIVAIGEPMLEFNQQPTGADGRRLYLEGPGGDTSNAAVAAARQGARVAYVTAVGEDPAGERFLDLWRDEGIDISAVRRSTTHATAVDFVTHGPKGHAFLYYRANSAASTLAPADIPVAMIQGARVLYASGISQGISASAADAVFHAIEVARAAGVRVAYDTNYRPRLWPAARAAAVIHAAMARADIALPSLEDAQVLTGLSDPGAICDFYLGLGPNSSSSRWDRKAPCSPRRRDAPRSPPSPAPSSTPPAPATRSAAASSPARSPATRRSPPPATPPPRPPSSARATAPWPRSPAPRPCARRSALEQYPHPRLLLRQWRDEDRAPAPP